jgi:hypothetical protein
MANGEGQISAMADDSSTSETKAGASPQEADSPSNLEKDGDGSEYPGGRALAMIMLALYLGVFLVALVSIKETYLYTCSSQPYC